MPYEGIGARHTALATKACVHGQIVVEDGFVGTAFRSQQVDRWTRPVDAARIVVDEEFELQIGGVHEGPLTGALASADIGDRVWIDPDNSLVTSPDRNEAQEIQTVTITGTPTGGTFTLTFDGETTAGIAYNAATSAVRSALEALPNIDPGDVTVGGSAGAWTVTFTRDQDEPQMSATGSLTGGTTPAVAVSTTTPGGTGSLPVGVITEVDPVREVARINSNAWQAFLPGA